MSLTTFKLGRLAPKPVALGDLTHYLATPLPAPPIEVDAPHLDYPMAGNDQYGDCTIAGVVHTDQATANLTTEPWTYPGDPVVEAEYFKLTKGADTGLAETDVLTAWHASDGLFGHQLAAFAPVNPKHQNVVKQTIALCGAAYVGVVLPATAQQQFAVGEDWHLTGTEADYQIVGGHCIVAVGYNRVGPVYVTWGKLQQATWRWAFSYVEELYAVITAEVKERGSLHGVNFAQLDKDLAALHAE